MIFLNFIISVTGGHCGCWAWAPKNLVAPVYSEGLCELYCAPGVSRVIKVEENEFGEACGTRGPHTRLYGER
jgi:hypothetical protein